MNNLSNILIAGLLIILGACSQAPYKTRLWYSNTFDSEQSLEDWQMEGPGLASVENGQLLLKSKYADATIDYLQQHQKKEDGGTAYYDFVESLVAYDSSEKVEAYKMDDQFVGGHLVFWNNTQTPDNYILEFDFQSKSPYALHMIMFSHLGLNGERVFSNELKPRNGLAAQYTKSDMMGYRISYYAPNRHTTHLRKSPEKQLLIKGEDLSLKDLEAVHHMRLIKVNNKVIWEIDGQPTFEYLEKDEDKVLGGGYFAIRLMVPAIGLYDNFRLWEIL